MCKVEFKALSRELVIPHQPIHSLSTHSFSTFFCPALCPTKLNILPGLSCFGAYISGNSLLDRLSNGLLDGLPVPQKTGGERKERLGYCFLAPSWLLHCLEPFLSLQTTTPMVPPQTSLCLPGTISSPSALGSGDSSPIVASLWALQPFLLILLILRTSS